MPTAKRRRYNTERLLSRNNKADLDIHSSSRPSRPRDVDSDSHTLKQRSNPPAQQGPSRGYTQRRNSGPRQQQGRSRSESTSRISYKQNAIPKRIVLDSEFLASKRELPTQEEYTEAPVELFSSKTRYHAICKLLKENRIRVVESEAIHKRKGARPLVRCTLQYGTKKVAKSKAVGEGPDKMTAQQAASLDLLAQIHKSGVLADLLVKPLDAEILQEEKDSIVDVYNYAVKYGFLPTFQIDTSTSGLHHTNVRISLPEHEIDVKAAMLEADHAFIAACRQFKRQAEAVQASGKYLGSVQSGLSSAKVSSFLAYCKLHVPGITLDIETEPTKLAVFGGGGHKAQALIESEAAGPPVIANNKKTAETLASLVLSITLIELHPELALQFGEAAKSSNGEILGPIRPITASFDPDMTTAMEKVLSQIPLDNLPSIENPRLEDDDHGELRRTRARRVLSEVEIDRKSRRLEEKLAAYANKPEAVKMSETRVSLPMNKYKEQVLEHIGKHAWSVIIGATGSGKTTQVPQILLEDAIAKGRGGACDVICTQPRRIAATSVARRVAEERLEQLQDTVGYHVKFDVKVAPRGGSITYCTTGILLQQLQNAPDEVFDTVSSIIVDEVHERDILIDFLLNLLRQTAMARHRAGKSVPKIVLMSATIDSKLFAEYFEAPQEDGSILECPSLSIPGRTFPVRDRYLEEIMRDMTDAHGPAVTKLLVNDRNTKDYMDVESDFKSLNSTASTMEQEAPAAIDWKRERTAKSDDVENTEADDALVPINLVAATIAHIAKTTEEGAILVFLPGYDEMKSTSEVLKTESPLGINFNDANMYRILMLHSSVPANEQAQVFENVPPGCRKIILSTNIAETSVTIPDVQFVVDSGKLREKRYDQVRRITKLQCTWISQSNAKQRAGRAGRVQNGNYYALYSRERFESFRAIGLPEMLRSDLQEICLDVKAHDFGISIANFLSNSIEPPAPAAVQSSIENLISLEALTDNEKLTALGRLLASLPVHPSLGKMIVFGVLFRCLDPVIILGAAMNERPIFARPPENRERARKQQEPFAEGLPSDHIALINAVRHTRLIEENQGPTAARNFCVGRFVHYGAYRVIKQTADQIEDVLVEAGIIPRAPVSERHAGEIGPSYLNTNATNTNVIIALALAGLQPNIAFWRGTPLRAPTENNVMVHPSSFVAPTRGRAARNGDDTSPGYGTFCTYSAMQKSNDGRNMFVRDLSVCSPMAVMLFGGRSSHNGKVFRINDWLPFYMHSNDRGRSTFIRFKELLDRLLAASFDSLSELRKLKMKTLKLRPRERAAQESTYLADNAQLETFAKGLVNVLDLGRRQIPKAGRETDGNEDRRSDQRNLKRNNFDFDVEVNDQPASKKNRLLDLIGG